MSDNNSKKQDPEIDGDAEFVPVDLFDPWDRQLSFDRRSSLLSPVLREGDAKAN